MFDTLFSGLLNTFAGRNLIYDIVTTSVSDDFFGVNPQSSLMHEIAYLVLDGNEFDANNN